MTAAHNAVRADVTPAPSEPLPPLEWSASLAQTAQSWAENLASSGCELRHSSSDYGENIYWVSGAGATAEDVVEHWASERSVFVNGPYDSCTDVCGHYSQIVWRDTRYLGCGRASCQDGAEIWVCNYDPPGNVLGQTPY
jgi:pathogenesis-related protein 1